MRILILVTGGVCVLSLIVLEPADVDQAGLKAYRSTCYLPQVLELTIPN